MDPAVVTVVHAGREEVRLCRLWTGQTPGNLFDLQLAAGLVGLTYPLGHGPLIGQLLGVHLSKGETRTEWRRRPLTPEQIRYAFDDVRCLLPAWKKLSARLDKLGRTESAREEFDRLARTASPEEPAVEERWRSSAVSARSTAGGSPWSAPCTTGARKPRIAPTGRRGPSSRDDLIVEIARRNPTRERDLQMLRGLPRRDLDAIVETAASAAKLPPEEWPAAVERDQDPPQVALTAAVLTAVLGDVCARLRLAPNLVASNQDVKRLVRARFVGGPLPDDMPLTQGWRPRPSCPNCWRCWRAVGHSASPT